MPGACAAATFNLAPTVSVCVPAVNVPVVDGVLTKFVTVIVFAPLVIVSAADGSVMAYVYAPYPFTVNAAAVTVPVVAGNVTPPVLVRAPAGVSVAVPAVLACTATLPKFMSVVFVMLIGVTIVPVDVAVAVACACTPLTEASITIAASINLVPFFIVWIPFYLFKKFTNNKHLNAAG